MFKMNKPAYEELITQDIAWLRDKSPQAIRRSHIEMVLKESIGLSYPPLDTKPCEYCKGGDRYHPGSKYCGFCGRPLNVKDKQADETDHHDWMEDRILNTKE